MNEPVTEDQQLPATIPEEVSVPALVQQAIAAGNIDIVERLVALKERQEERHAQAALIQALHDFQAVCPEVERSKQVNTSKGQRAYKYAPFEDVKEAISPALRDSGLMFSHTVEEKAVICRVSHRDGASVESSFPLTAWEGTSMQNTTQKMASAISYAKRYSLLGALGIATRDDDARGTDEPVRKEDIGSLYQTFIAQHGKEGDPKARFRDWIRANVFKGKRSDDDLRDPEKWTRQDFNFANDLINRASFDDYGGATDAEAKDAEAKDGKEHGEAGAPEAVTSEVASAEAGASTETGTGVDAKYATPLGNNLSARIGKATTQQGLKTIEESIAKASGDDLSFNDRTALSDEITAKGRELRK